MKPFVEIQVDVTEISNEIIDYISADDSISLYEGSPWKFLNTRNLMSSCPALLDFFKKHKLVVKDSAITYITNTNDLPMHVDEKPVVAKMNFPVLNTQGWTNKWFTVDNLENYPKVKNQFDSEVYDLSTATGVLLAEYHDMTHPIVFNSSIAHSVEQYSDDAKSPRIVASFTFHKEPIEWLE
jgi:hypothetical protein